MGRNKSYIQIEREQQKDEMTTMQVWKSDLAFLNKVQMGLGPRDTLHEIIKNYVRLQKENADRLGFGDSQND